MAKRGNVYRWKGDWTRAIADYDRALSLNPRLDETYFGRDLARQHLNDLDGALAGLTKALESGRFSAHWHAARAKIFRQKGDDEKALADFDLSVKFARQNSGMPDEYLGGHAGRGQLFFEQSEIGRALADFDAVVHELSIRGELPRDALLIYGDRGRGALGEFPAAAADFARLRDARPPDPYIALWLFLAQARNSKAGKAVLKEQATGAA